MRTRQAIEERLRTLTRAYHLECVHRDELGSAAQAKLRILQESIALLQWCLEDEPEPQETSRKGVWPALRTAFSHLSRKLPGRLGWADTPPDHSVERPQEGTPNEVTR